MIKKLSLLTLLILPFIVKAEVGDTLVVQSHGHVNMVWNGAYDQTAFFPTKDQSYRKIIMKYTLGCATGGCSDWDYDVNIYLRDRPGYLDSSVSKVDTISKSPLVIDTTWRVFEAVEQYELGRYITPYGSYMNYRNGAYRRAGFDSSWQHDFYFDVTDYYQLLQDTVEIRSHFRGWSSGFSATTQFLFIEGPRAQDVLGVKNIYTKGGTYSSSENFEKNVAPAKTIEIPEGSKRAVSQVIVSGHGQNSTTGCAEFCPRYYQFKANDEVVSQTNMWRDDCGINPVKPQGGTWIFDRGNWCPGDIVFKNFHDVSKHLGGENIKLDLDIEKYTFSGNGNPSYNLTSTVFFYGAPNHEIDAAVEDIIAPTHHDEYQHWNPICGNPVVVIKNEGSQDLTFAKITYGLEGFPTMSYEWEGHLSFQQIDTVTLPPLLWDGSDQNNKTFTVKIEYPNRTRLDEVESNDVLTSLFAQPESYPNQFKLVMRTNGQPQENALKVTNLKTGEIVHLNDNLQANTTYEHDLNLANGCYELLLSDEGKDGLSFWYYAQTGQNTRTGGRFYIARPDGLPLNQYDVNRFGGDFGTEIRSQFVVGNFDYTENPERTLDQLLISPNPSSGVIDISMPIALEKTISIQIHNLMGQEIRNIESINADALSYYNNTFRYQINLGELHNGIYIVTVSDGTTTNKKKIILEH